MTPERDTFTAVRASLEAAPRGVFQVSREDGETGGENANAPHLLVRTSLVYPRGGKITVYVRPRGSGYLVTDRGATMAMLGRYLSSDTGDGERWEPAVRRLCEGLGIRMRDREWTVPARRDEDVGGAAMLLAQGLLRAAIMAPVFKITRETRRGNG